MGDVENKGQGDVDVSLFNVISSNGKQLKDLAPKAWNSITITESMGLLSGDTKFISGHVTINDKVDIFNEMSLIGDEIVEIKFRTPQKEGVDFVGRVYNVSVNRPNKDTRIITLRFCSTEKITSDQLKMNRAYRNVKYSDMAKDIFTPFVDIGGKKIYAEETINRGSIILNNKSPIAALDMIAKVSVSSLYRGSSYIFFETHKPLPMDAKQGNPEGIFQFASLESLIDPEVVKPSITYVMDPPSGKKNDIRKLVGIKQYKVLNLPNTVGNIKNGMYSGTVVSNDLMKRKIEYNTFNYNEEYKNFKSVNFNSVNGKETSLINNKTYGKRDKSFLKFVPKHYGSFSTQSNYLDDRALTILRRNSQLRQINAVRLQLIVSGDSQRRAGEIVEVKIPAMEEGTGKLDALLSGRYLIAKVMHNISSVDNEYNTSMELIKDSFANPLPEKA